MATQADEYRILALLRKRFYWVRFSSELSNEFFSPITSSLYDALGLWYAAHPGEPDDFAPISSIRMIGETQLGLNEEERNDLGKGIKRFRRYARTLDESTVLSAVTTFIQSGLVRSVIVDSIDKLDALTELDLGEMQDRLKRAVELDFVVESPNVMDALAVPMVEVLHEAVDETVGTLIESLDRALKGGLAKGELGVVAGAANVGKTSVLTNFALAAVLQGFTVAYFTHEISKKKVAARVYERIMGLPVAHLRRRGNLEKLQKKLKALRKRGAIHIYDYSAQVTRVGVISQDVEVYNATHEKKIGMVLVDYADLLEPTQHYSDYRFEVANIYRYLRQMAVHLQLPVWTASQLRRDAGRRQRVATLTDLPEAYEAKSGIPDTVITLNQTPEEYEENLLRVFIAKSRREPKRIVIKLEFYPSRNLLRGMR